ncbi:MAG: hypothetical protein HWE26_22350 [Alteromonadaceae bacterium]|nr:hypothetical protein [Alteromonadaceae bacterium]
MSDTPKEYRKKKPSITRPGVDRAQGFGGHYGPPPTNSTPAKEDKPKADATTTPDHKGETAPTQPDDATVSAPPPKETTQDAQKPKARERNVTQETAPKTSTRTVASKSPSRAGRGEPMKTVALTAYPKEEQRAALEAAQSDVVPIMDMVKLAGRRALARFEPKGDYIPVPDMQRMSANYRYTTTKQVNERLLQELHDAFNPLGLKSDNEMLRGQFEPLFWSELDGIIKEMQGMKRK